MKKVDYLLSSDILSTLLLNIYQLRVKYNLNEVAIWDLVIIFQYHKATGKGTTIYQLSKAAFRPPTSYPAIKERRARMAKKGLLTYDKGKSYLTDLGYQEIKSLAELAYRSLIVWSPVPANPVRTEQKQAKAA